MAPAAASNWLSFSLSSMEMLANSTHSHSHSHSHTQTSQILPPPQLHPSHHFFLDPFYSNGNPLLSLALSISISLGLCVMYIFNEFTRFDSVMI